MAKTGEKRQVNKQLNIDKLPLEVRDRIQQLRAQGYTWGEIEEQSAKFVKWEELPTRVLELFPEMRIPHSNLQRWYDLRVEQVREEMKARAEQAREFAAALTERGFKDLPEAVRNLLGDLLFTQTEAHDDKTRVMVLAQAAEVGELLQKYRLNDLREKKLAIDERKVRVAERQLELKKKAVDKATNEAAAKLGKGKPVTVDDINRIRERTFGLPPVQR